MRGAVTPVRHQIRVKKDPRQTEARVASYGGCRGYASRIATISIVFGSTMTI
jgi:hypothetical protein